MSLCHALHRCLELASTLKGMPAKLRLCLSSGLLKNRAANRLPVLAQPTLRSAGGLAALREAKCHTGVRKPVHPLSTL